MAAMALVFYIAFAASDRPERKPAGIKISGNFYLAGEQYLEFARLDEISGQQLTAGIVRDRIIKHPYIKSVRVRMENDGYLSVKVEEYIIRGLLLVNDEDYYVTGNLTLLPVVPYTVNADVPVITLNDKENRARLYNKLNTREMKSAMKVVESARLFDDEFYRELSQVDIDETGNITVFLSNVNYPVLLGRENEVKKTAGLASLTRYTDGKSVNDYLKYIDFRYENLIYLGFSSKILEGTSS